MTTMWLVTSDIWFRIRPNLGPFLVTFRSLLTSSEVPKVSNFCYYISGSAAMVVLTFSQFSDMLDC